MRKLLVSAMALMVVGIGMAAYAGPLSDALNNAADTVSKKEAAITQAQKDAEARQKARQEAAEKKKLEYQKQREQAKKDAEARQKARQEELQKKKDAWNTLIGK